MTQVGGSVVTFDPGKGEPGEGVVTFDPGQGVDLWCCLPSPPQKKYYRMTDACENTTFAHFTIWAVTKMHFNRMCTSRCHRLREEGLCHLPDLPWTGTSQDRHPPAQRPPSPREQTNMSKNITFPKLC